MWSENVTGAVARGVYQVGFAIAALLHVGEAGYAWHRARQGGLSETAVGWGLQTFVVGFPSLLLLLAKLERRAGAAC